MDLGLTESRSEVEELWGRGEQACMHGMSWKSADPGALVGRGEDGPLGETARRRRRPAEPLWLLPVGTGQWVPLSPGPR